MAIYRNKKRFGILGLSEVRRKEGNQTFQTEQLTKSKKL